MTIASQDNTFRPVFVVGAPRSGTTLLSVLLDRHSELAMTAETHFFSVVLPKLWQCKRSHSAYVDRMLSCPPIDDLQLERDLLLERFATMDCSALTLFQAVMQIFAAKRHAKLVGEKTPQHLAFVPLILRWFPEARIVCIMRDGRDVAQSLVKAPWTHKNIRWHAMTWRRAARMGAKFCRQYPEQFRIAKYEQLLEDPQKTLTEIDAFLGLASEPAQLETEQRSDEGESVIPQWESQWKQQAAQALDKDNVARWMTQTPASQKWLLNSVMSSGLQRFDYPDAQWRDCPAARKLLLYSANAVHSIAYWVFLSWRRLQRWIKRLLGLCGCDVTGLKMRLGRTEPGRPLEQP